MRRLMPALVISWLVAAVSTYGQSANTRYLLLNEISPYPSDDILWVELINPTDYPTDLSGYSITFFSGFSYTFPEASETIDPNNLHVLQIPVKDLLNASGDGCMLSFENDIIDIITWGTPPSQPIRTSVSPGPPLLPFHPVISDDEELFTPDDVLIRNPNLLPPSNGDYNGSRNWAYRSSESASPGLANPVPPPVRFSPVDGTEFASDPVLYVVEPGWTGPTVFQVARDLDFTDMVIEETVDGSEILLENLDAGTYYWRAGSSSDDTGSLTSPLSFVRMDFDMANLLAKMNGRTMSSNRLSDPGKFVARAKVGGNMIPPALVTQITSWAKVTTPHIFQNKDTNLVCLDGCDMAGDCPWCETHKFKLRPTGGRWMCDHGNMSCTVACMAMIAATGGKEISQDRINYYIFEEMGQASKCARATRHIGDPIGDLGYHFGTYHSVIPPTLNWLYGNVSGNAYNDTADSQTFYNADAAMNSIMEFIDDGRPVLRHSRRHTTLITGYAVIEMPGGVKKQYIEVQDPWFNRPNDWLSYGSTVGHFNRFTYPPSQGRPMREDELSIDVDTDGDGLFDFDEIMRFNTNPNDPDSDHDGVNDKEDILGYVFESDGKYFLGEPDMDGDGVWKELDPDNDDLQDDSEWDGCEDTNHNGLYDLDGRETDCFTTGDDGRVVNPECSRGFFRIVMDAYIQNAMTIEHYYLEEIIIKSSDHQNFVHPFRYENILAIDYTNGCIAKGELSLSGLARIRLEKNEATGEYMLYTDTDLEEQTFTTNMSCFGMTNSGDAAVGYFFDNDATWLLGVPIEEDGGRVCRGQQEVAGWDIFEGPLITEWEIWIDPPVY